MDGVKLQGKIYSGYSKAALRIGLPMGVYQPTSVTAPLGNLKTTIPVSFNAIDWTYTKASGYGKPVWNCLADGTQLQVGDYLVGAPGTFFIASMQPILPILAVECNRTVTVSRPQQQYGVGQAPYGGNTAQNETAVITGYPASLLISAKTNESTAKLPGDAKQAGWMLLLPIIPSGAVVLNDDIVVDELNNRYIVIGAELTDMGWRCNLYTSET